jgi:hypothetical protein
MFIFGHRNYDMWIISYIINQKWKTNNVDIFYEWKKLFRQLNPHYQTYEKNKIHLNF